jgi:hypothetical protein
LGAPEPSSLARSVIPTLQRSLQEYDEEEDHAFPERTEFEFGDSSTIPVQVEEVRVDIL